MHAVKERQANPNPRPNISHLSTKMYSSSSLCCNNPDSVGPSLTQYPPLQWQQISFQQRPASIQQSELQRLQKAPKTFYCRSKNTSSNNTHCPCDRAHSFNSRVRYIKQGWRVYRSEELRETVQAERYAEESAVEYVNGYAEGIKKYQ